MTEYNNILIDPCGNANYIYKYNATTPENSEPIYGISGEQYIIKYGASGQTANINGQYIDISGMPFIGYGDTSMNLYDVDGNNINLSHVNKTTIIENIIHQLVTRN